MAKVKNSVSLQGELTVADMELVEVSKESVNTYDLNDILRRFDGRTISLVITETEDLTPKSVG